MSTLVRDGRTWTPWRACVALTILLLLQVVVSAPWNLEVPPWLAAVCRPSPDLIALAALALLARAAGWARLGAWIAGLLLWIVVLLGQPIVLFPLIFQRPFELADMLQLPGLVHLLMQRSPGWVQTTVLLAVVAIWPLFALGLRARPTAAVRTRGALRAPFVVLAAWLLLGPVAAARLATVDAGRGRQVHAARAERVARPRRQRGAHATGDRGRDRNA